MSFPYEGQYYLSSEKKHSELIFFVHFYLGNKRALARHIKAVNNLGYDAFAFNLHSAHIWEHLPLTAMGQFGLKHVFADQIEHLLNLLPGKKIVFSFSNPSASAIEALSRRACFDVSALICDSGPSGRFKSSALRLAMKFFSQKKIKRALFTGALMWGWSPRFHRDIFEQLGRFPKDFPILSIRGWKDPLISPGDIDLVFEPHKHLSWRKLSLPEGHHLDGLKKHSAEYLAGLKSFLEHVTQK